MHTRRLFNLLMAVVFSVSLAGAPQTASAQGSEPFIKVWLDSGEVEGFNWPLGSQVNVTVDRGGTTLSASAMPEPANWDPDGTSFNVVFGPAAGIQPGDLVTMSNDTMTLEIRPLPVMITSKDVNHFAGTTTPGRAVHVWSDTWQLGRDTTADEGTGEWSVDFTVSQNGSGTLTTLDGSGGRAEIYGQDGGITSLHWSVLSPTFEVRTNTDGVEALQWPLGDRLTATLHHPNGEPADYTVDGIVGTADWDPSQTYLWFDGSGKFDIQPGDEVTITDGIVTRSAVVANLELTRVDIDMNQVYGMAEPNQTVYIWACAPNGGYCTHRTVLATDAGSWVANFNDDGSGDSAELDDQWWIDSNVSSEDGGTTFYGMEVWGASVHAVPSGREVHGHGWPWNGRVRAIVDNDLDPGNGTLYDRTWRTGEDTECGEPCFNLAGVVDLQVGQYVTMTQVDPPFIWTNGGPVSHTVRVSALKITNLDEVANTLAGIADAGSTVQVNIWSQDGISRTVQADAQGNWSVDFKVAGNDPDQRTADIVPGDNGRAIQLNPDGSDDGTLEYWDVPNPQLRASLDGDMVEGEDWPLGSEVDITVEHDGQEYTASAVSRPAAWDPNTLYFGAWLGGVVDIEAGDTVMATGGGTTRTMLTLPLELTGIDLAGDKLTGTTQAEARVSVWTDNGNGRDVIADNQGNWTVDFSQPGDWSPALDIVPGVTGGIRVTGPDHGQTGINWYADTPVCTAGSTVSGFVFERDGMTPTPSVRIDVERYDTGEAYCHASTGTNGNYSFSLPQGTYRIKASEVTHAAQYYDGADQQNAAPIEIDTATQRTGINFKLIQLVTVEHIEFNLRNPLLQDYTIRKAIALGIDRERILNNAFLPNRMFGAVLNSIVPPEHWAAPQYWTAADLARLTLYPFDPGEAGQLLTYAGWIDRDTDGIRENEQGTELSFDFKARPIPVRTASSEILVEEMQAIGIRLIVTLSEGDWLGEGNWDIAEFAWAPDYPEDEIPFSHLYVTGAPSNLNGYSNAQLDAAAAAAAAASTREQKLPYYIDEQVLLASELPVIPLFTRYNTAAALTPVGSEVMVEPAPAITVNFSSVQQAGQTAALLSGGGGAPLPANFEALGRAYDIGTSAEFTSAQVCLDYDDTGLTAAQEQAVRLLHLEAGIWQDVTDAGYPDMQADRVCGTVTSFSPFVVAYATATNEPPVIEYMLAPASPAKIGTAMNVSAAFSDPDANDTFTATWDWGDGTTSAGTIDGTTATGTHTYSQPGIYTLEVTVSDQAGAAATQAFEYFIVVYDPNGGFVTAGGWFREEAAGEKVNYGINAKYPGTGSVPTGDAEIRLPVGTYKSKSYQWLVLSGARATVRGTGTLNGKGQYGFLLSVIDGQQLAAKPPDSIRIKIWDTVTGAVVYDTQLGAPDTANPTLQPGGGNIQMHQ